MFCVTHVTNLFLFLAALVQNPAGQPPVIQDSRPTSAPVVLLPCATPAECLARVQADLKRMLDPQNIEATGGDAQKMGRGVADQVLEMVKRFPDAPETVQAKLAFLAGGVVAFFRAEGNQFLDSLPIEKLAPDDLRRAGDAAIMLNRREIDQRVISAWLAQEPDMAHRVDLWFFLSGQPTVEYRKDTLRTAIATSARNKEELGYVALKNAEWELRFGSRRGEDYERMLQGTLTNYPGTPAAELAAARLRARGLKPGDELPPVTFTDLAGKPVAGRDLAGKVAVVWFWAEWQNGFAQLAETLRQDPALAVLAVSVDAGGDALRAQAEKLKLPGILVDGTSAANRDPMERMDALRGGLRDCRVLVLDAQGKVVDPRAEPDTLAAALQRARQGAPAPRSVKRR